MTRVLRKVTTASALIASVLAHASSTSDSKAFLDAMVRNVGMIEVDCPPEVEAPGTGTVAVCLGPYWSWKEFRRLWDEAADDPARVPVVPAAIQSWTSEGGAWVRAYRLGDSEIRVAFDKRRGSAILTALSSSSTQAPAYDPPSADGAAVTSPPGTEPAAEFGAPVEIDVPPQVIAESRTAAAYPARALARKIAATVELHVIVGPDGAVEGVIVESCSQPGRGFEDAAVRAVSRWRYIPAQRQGRPIRAATRVAVEFAP